MAKMKISGAKPSQPPDPMLCSANKFAMLIMRCPRNVRSTQTDQYYACRRVVALCILPQDFSLPQAGDSFSFRHCTGDAGLWLYSRLLPRKKLGLIPKRNR